MISYLNSYMSNPRKDQYPQSFRSDYNLLLDYFQLGTKANAKITIVIANTIFIFIEVVRTIFNQKLKREVKKYVSL
jgi:hypothetical protein